jgi:hypothetical protein
VQLGEPAARLRQCAIHVIVYCPPSGGYRGPLSQQWPERMLAGAPQPDLHKITAVNAAKMFGFSLS